MSEPSWEKEPSRPPSSFGLTANLPPAAAAGVPQTHPSEAAEPTVVSLRAPVGGYSGVYFGPPVPSSPALPSPVAPPPRRSPAWLWAVLAAVGLVALTAGVAAAVWGRPIYDEYPTKVSAPSRLAGMNLVEDPELTTITNQLNDDFRTETGAKDSVAGFYAPAGDKEHGILVVAVSGLYFQPANQIESVLGGHPAGGLTVHDVQSYPSGRRGSVRCGSTAAAGVPVAVCVWGDHGSLGIAVFYNRTVADAAALVLSVRADMVQHG